MNTTLFQDDFYLFKQTGIDRFGKRTYSTARLCKGTPLIQQEYRVIDGVIIKQDSFSFRTKEQIEKGDKVVFSKTALPDDYNVENADDIKKISIAKLPFQSISIYKGVC